MKTRPMGTGILVCFLAACWASGSAAADEATARAILTKTDIQGGLVVHVGCGDGKLTAALHAGDAYLVHGLDRDATNVAAARAHIRSKGLYGPVTVASFDGKRLPYRNNMVRLLVAEDLGEVPMSEVMRVLCPGGVAHIGTGADVKVTFKQWPADLDEWTHALHGPDNNAVAHDHVVGPPERLQWIGGPLWARSHDHLSSASAVVSSGGRVFAILDEGSTAAVALSAQWRLVAWDAFSGVLLWKQDIGPWEGHLRGFRTGPAAIQRRLVAVDDTVYVTLGYGKPVTALDAATGKVKRKYRRTDDALEFVCADGVLYVVTGPELGHGAALPSHDRGRFAAYVSPGGRGIVAVEANTGMLLWKKEDADTSELMPTALAVNDGRLFFQNTQELICLGATSGNEQWRAERPVATSRWAWTAPTLVAYGDVVLSADRDAESRIAKEWAKEAGVDAKELDEEGLVWVVYSKGGEAPEGKLIAFSAATGKRLWDSKAREVYNAPVDVLVADGLVWTGELVRSKEPGITQGLDPLTGEVKRTRPPDSEFFNVGMGHHRCHRNKATDRYLVLGRSGVEWIDVKTGEGFIDHWVRGACQYGVMPCNGLLYAPPHSCACYVEGKLSGFLALAPKDTEPAAKRPALDARLKKGSAYGAVTARETSQSPADEWPTYRNDAARTGRTASSVPLELNKAWTNKLGGALTGLVVTDGKVFVAQLQTHTVYALNAATGEVVWQRTVGGRVDSPPTIFQGLCLFGCRDGYVYGLRAEDGKLAWRFLAAPTDKRIVANNELESVWPVNGSVLIHDGSLYCAAGRCSYVDGGMELYRLNPVTGEVLAHRQLDSRDPETGREPQKPIRGVTMPGALPDVLSSDGESIYMRQLRFDADLNDQPLDVPHLFCPAGFLDESWWHRTYWQFGTQMQAGWGGWGKAGYGAPAGRIMVVGESDVYAFGRLNQYGTAGTHVGLASTLHPWGDEPDAMPHYVLFASGKVPQITQVEARRRGFDKRLVPQWTQPSTVWVRAMTLADNGLLLAGTLEPTQHTKPIPDPFHAERPGVLRMVSPKDGSLLSEHALSAPPAWDAMAVAGGCVYVSTTDGNVTCMKGG